MYRYSVVSNTADIELLIRRIRLLLPEAISLLFKLLITSVSLYIIILEYEYIAVLTLCKNFCAEMFSYISETVVPTHNRTIGNMYCTVTIHLKYLNNRK